jgi:hypothetical protein
MGSRYGRDFWEGWFYGGTTGSIDAQPAAGPAGLLDQVRQLNQLVRPLFGLALLGLIGIVRDWWHAAEDPARHHGGLLLVWIGIALMIRFLTSGQFDPGSPADKMWETLLTVPLAMAAALGLIDIAERRGGFIPAMAFGGLALADAVLMVGEWFSQRDSESVFSVAWGVRLWALDVISLTALAAGGLWAIHFSRSRDARKRGVLIGMLAAIVSANFLWGALAVRRTTPGDRELEELRAGMARLPRMNECTFVALAPPGTSLDLRPPPQIVFVLASLWPGARMNYASSWEDAAEEALAESKSAETRQPVFIAWSPRGRIRSAAPAANLRSAASPFLYRDVEFASYVRDPSSQAALAPQN